MTLSLLVYFIIEINFGKEVKVRVAGTCLKSI